MNRTEIGEIFLNARKFGGRELTVCGWVRTLRDSKKIGFIELNDGSAFSNLQVIMEADKLENYAQIAKLNVGSALVVRGTIALTPGSKQPLEMHAMQVDVEGACPPAHQYFFRRVSSTRHALVGDTQVYARAQVYVYTDPADYSERLRGSGRNVPRQHTRPKRAAAHTGRRC